VSLWDFYLGRTDHVVEPPAVRSAPSSKPSDPRRFLGRRPGGARALDMAKTDRLSFQWGSALSTADGEVRYQQQKIVAKARALEQNDPFVQKYLQLLESNVVGELGILLDPLPESARNRRRVDGWAKRQLDAAFREWSKRGACTVCGKYSLADLQRRVIRSVATDGELFVRFIRGPRARNRFGFALQVLETEWVDFDYSGTADNGNEIRMGVELSDDFRPVAYYFLTRAPDDTFATLLARDTRNRTRVRVPAEEVLHIALWPRLRPGQTRGVSWFAPVGESIYQLNQYRRAELIAAREGASVNGYYKQPLGEDGFSGDYSDVDEYGYLEDVEAGEKKILPPGWEYEVKEATHPTTAFGDFSTSLIRSIASGFGLSYESVAADLSRASYSSGRIGALEDRQVFRTLQTWVIDSLLERVYLEWIPESLLRGAINLDPRRTDRLEPHRWQTRGWAWVDPQKEASGNQIAIANGTKLLSDIVSDSTGRPLPDHAERLAEEIKLYEENGLVHPAAAALAPKAEPTPPGQGEGDELEDDPEEADE